MSDIFISYANADKPIASRLANILENKGYSVWWDKLIPPGESWDIVIERELDSAKCIVVLWSSYSVKSDWVKLEATEGARRKAVLPVLIQNVKMPLQFRGLQPVDLVKWRGASTHPRIKDLLTAVARLTGSGKKERIVTLEAIPPPKTVFPRTAFERDIIRLLEHSNKGFQGLRRHLINVSDDGYREYQPDFSLSGSTSNVFRLYLDNTGDFECDLARGVHQIAAETIFQNRIVELKTILLSDWTFRMKNHVSSSIKKEFIARHRTEDMEITIRLLGYTRKSWAIEFYFNKF